MELYHVINRGVDGRKIFMDSQDCARFVHDLYEFNDTAPALEFHHATSRTTNVGRTTSYMITEETLDRRERKASLAAGIFSSFPLQIVRASSSSALR
jgi:hypothetical protein